MPLVDAGFYDQHGRPDSTRLVSYGPTLQVQVGAYPQTNPAPDPQVAHALVDTGAAQSCIDAQLAQRLQLPVVDVVAISGAAGTSQHDVYLANVTIPALAMSQYGAFAGVDLEGGGQEHRVLLGRTFLQGTIMIYDGLRAQVTLASQQPQPTPVNP